MEISADYVIEFINQYLMLPTRNGWTWSARCPICGDSKKSATKKRLSLTYNPTHQDGVVHCYNCNYSAPLAKFICEVKKITFKELCKELGINSLETLKKKPQKVKVEEVKQEESFEDFSWILNDCIQTPSGIIQENLWKLFEDFKKSRCIDYPMYCCYRGQYKARAILPIYQGDKMAYFQARTLIGKDPKYKNPISPKKHIIFNKDNWDSSKPVVVTEGLMDALSVGVQGTMCLGAFISDEFLEKLPNDVIIALDNDEAGKKSMLKIATESKYRNNLRFCIYPKSFKQKDLNELLCSGVNVYQFILDNSVNAFKAKLSFGVH